jgi:hypothetical protein
MLQLLVQLPPLQQCVSVICQQQQQQQQQSQQQ